MSKKYEEAPAPALALARANLTGYDHEFEYNYFASTVWACCPGGNTAQVTSSDAKWSRAKI